MKNNWKEEFDKRFSFKQNDLNGVLAYEEWKFCDPTQVKDFITSLLAEQKKELLDILLSKGEDNQNCYEGCYRDWVTKIESLKHHD